MTPQVAEALRIVAARKPLPRDLAERTFLDLMDGKATEAQKGALLLGIATRGETAEEIAGAVAALRTRMRRVQTRRSPLLDTCGPGGIGRDLFNISTAAAVVAAGAGAAVAKHGNRSISSRVGSADVLSACGVAIDLGPETAGRVLDEVGLVFLFAPSFHPAMKELGTVRRELGVRTIFNALGPLANPAGATRQLIGVGRPEPSGCRHAPLPRDRAGCRLPRRTAWTRARPRRPGRVSRSTTAGRAPGSTIRALPQNGR
jgi:anthranilate phosphoribosyltransferase